MRSLTLCMTRFWLVLDQECAAECYRLKQECFRSGEKIDCGRLAALANKWLVRDEPTDACEVQADQALMTSEQHSDIALKTHGANVNERCIRDVAKRICDPKQHCSKTHHNKYKKKAKIANLKAAKAAALEEEVAKMSEYQEDRNCF